jgi:hypothetical protein
LLTLLAYCGGGYSTRHCLVTYFAAWNAATQGWIVVGISYPKLWSVRRIIRTPGATHIRKDALGTWFILWQWLLRSSVVRHRLSHVQA